LILILEFLLLIKKVVNDLLIILEKFLVVCLESSLLVPQLEVRLNLACKLLLFRALNLLKGVQLGLFLVSLLDGKSLKGLHFVLSLLGISFSLEGGLAFLHSFHLGQDSIFSLLLSLLLFGLSCLS